MSDQFATVGGLKKAGSPLWHLPVTSAKEYYTASVEDNMNGGRVGELVDEGREAYLIDRAKLELGMEPCVAICDVMLDRPQSEHVEFDLKNGPVVVHDNTAVVWK